MLRFRRSVLLSTAICSVMLSTSSAIAQCTADIAPVIDGQWQPDGFVDVTDLNYVMAKWGPCPTDGSPCHADIDGNGVVDVDDLNALLAQWGSCDFDGDGISDSWELEYGLDPNNPSDALRDLDFDGLSSLREYFEFTNPILADSDGDLACDGYEVLGGADPLFPGDNGDGDESEDVVWIKVKIGDQSPGHDELWQLTIGESVYTDPNGQHDVWTSPAIPVKIGNTYPITVQWLSGEMDYDYTAQILYCGDDESGQSCVNLMENRPGDCPSNPTCQNNWFVSAPVDRVFLHDPDRLMGVFYGQDWCGASCDRTIGKVAYLVLALDDPLPEIPVDSEGISLSTMMAGSETDFDSVSEAFDTMQLRYRITSPYGLDLTTTWKASVTGGSGVYVPMTNFSFLGQHTFTLEYLHPFPLDPNNPGVEIESQEFQIIGGVPATIDINDSSSADFVLDGAGSRSLGAQVLDEWDEPIANHPVTWLTFYETCEFEQPVTYTGPDGWAYANLDAGEGPAEGIATTIRAAAAEIESEIDIPVASVSGAISTSVTQVDLSSQATAFTATFSTNAFDGAEVFWTVSNGLIVGANDADLGPRSKYTNVFEGAASIVIEANPVDSEGFSPDSRVGECHITATTGGRIFHTTVDFYDLGTNQVQFDETWVMVGDDVDDGIMAVPFASDIQLPPGEQAIIQPSTHYVSYSSILPVTICGQPGAYVQVYVVDVAHSGLISVHGGDEGQGSSSSTYLCGAQIGPDGKANISFASAGVFGDGSGVTPPEMVQIQFDWYADEAAVSGGGPDFSSRETVAIVERTTWGYLKDSVIGFFGGDPNTAAGIAANVAGGMLIVGDIGSLVKNLWRGAGMSDEEVNWAEVALSGAGLLTELAIGVGEVADAPISFTRAICAAVGNVPFSKACVIILKRALSSADDLVRLTKFFKSLIINGALKFDIARAVFNSDELLEAGLRGHDRLYVEGSEDVVNAWFHAIEGAAQNADEGLGAARAISWTAGFPDNIPVELLDDIRALPFDEAAEAWRGIGRVISKGVDPNLLTDVLKSQQPIWTQTFTRDVFIKRLDEIVTDDGLEGIDKVLHRMKIDEFNNANGAKMELNTAADTMSEFNVPGNNYRLRSLEEDVAPRPPLTGTDIDVLLEPLTAGQPWVIVQAKTTFEAMNSVASQQKWVEKVVWDAVAKGRTPIIVRYAASNMDEATFAGRKMSEGLNQIVQELRSATGINDISFSYRQVPND